MAIFKKTKAVQRKTIAVIGGGWAGAAAVAELVQAGHQIDWLEASRHLGGRARALELHDKMLDNGQHILLGAYQETLTLCKRLGLDLDQQLLRLPLQMVYPHQTGMRFIAPRLPAPLHLGLALIRADGLSKDDKLALARFSTTARWMDWQLNVDCTVSELLERYQQTPRLIDLMWRPLCIAALNTLPEHASANVFLAVLRDSLGAKRCASDMLLPKTDLSSLLPNAVAQLLEQQGGRLFLGARLEALEKQGAAWRLHGNLPSELSAQSYDAVVLATPVESSRGFLQQLKSDLGMQLLSDAHSEPRSEEFEHAEPKEEQATSTIPEFAFEAISTCYLQYDPEVRLERAFFALRDHPQQQRFAQFVFDRGQLNSTQAGLLAVVISAPQEAMKLDRDTLTQSVAKQLAEDLQMPTLQQPIWSQLITEKRATFRCEPNLVRPSNRTIFNGLVLAGDYTQSDYPATLETAVRSGLTAARLLSR